MCWQRAVEPIIARLTSDRGVPGLVIAVARDGQPPAVLAAGSDATGRALTVDALFPVASLTKLATALAVLRLAAVGALQLDEPLAVHLPAAGAAQPGVTLRSLLCHTSGLPLDVEPWLAPYAAGLDWPTLAQACLATPLAHPPQSQVVYSNLGPGLLALVVERLTRQPFPAALHRLVLAPLGIEGYLGSPPPRPPAVIAGQLGAHAGTPLEPFNSAFYRGLALPWAGLVTTAAGALALVQAFGGEPAPFLPRALCAEATRDQTGGLGGVMFEPLRWPRNAWGLGVELRGEKTPHWTPPQAAPTSFGHTGASGCIAWRDPVAGCAWAILGARTMAGWWREWPALGAAILGSAA